MNKSVLFSLLLILVAFQSSKAADCPGHYGKNGVVNLCPSNFPTDQDEKVYFVKMYAPWCGHCKQLTPKWEELAQQLEQEDKDIVISGIDCTEKENSGICQKYGVQGYPTLKAIVYGKAKAYNGARETQDLKSFILQVKKEKETSCPNNGVFKSGVKDSVTVFCKNNFPQNMVVGFYEKANFSNLQKDTLNDVAQQFGMDPPQKLKRARQKETVKERLSAMANRNKLQANLPSSGQQEVKALIDVGSVCCDCSENNRAFCQERGISAYPTYQVYYGGEGYTFGEQGTASLNVNEFIKFALLKLRLATSREEL